MTDKSLITLITKALTASGLPTSVQPGPLCFPLPGDADADPASDAASDIDHDNNNNNNDKKETAAKKKKLHAICMSLEEDSILKTAEAEAEVSQSLSQRSGSGLHVQDSGGYLDEQTLVGSSLDIQVDLRV